METEETMGCWSCQAPVRPSWPRCPNCKADARADSSASTESLSLQRLASPLTGLDLALIGECWPCQAPVKLSWSVCPGCKAPTTKPLSDSPAAQDG